MEIGDKIKSLRISKRMTQAELAGDQITRNMLSLVENGSALPSLPTIMYLSERLGVPAGMFLARESEEPVYRKMSDMPRIKNAFESKEYRLCCDMCENLLGYEKDDEISFILARCHFEIGKEEFNSGRLHNTCREFDRACEYCNDTIYDNGEIASAVAVYFEYMLRLSPTLTSDYGYEEYKGNVTCLDEFCKYANALKNVESGNVGAVEAYLKESFGDDNGFISHIKALLEMADGDYRSASERLKALINSSDIDCRVIMYDVFRNFEDCCRETGDYKGAYEYSVGKVELLEHMLTDINI